MNDAEVVGVPAGPRPAPVAPVPNAPPFPTTMRVGYPRLRDRTLGTRATRAPTEALGEDELL